MLYSAVPPKPLERFSVFKGEDLAILDLWSVVYEGDEFL
jgi:hypothetical protein